ncbi:hypothetical protein [Erwinia amylovora]|uniref:hypothetical protein n=3 Tax=Erwinia amylovora TaxID=552 RepID=UPI0014445122|nr:hypothetical protein [Erwinia amylovora]
MLQPNKWKTSALNLQQDKELIAKVFEDCFEKQSFSFHEPDALVPSRDDSTLFTGSTISTFKYLLKNNEKKYRYFTRQKCLRTQNSKLLSNGEYPKWSSLFESVGAICSIDYQQEIVSSTLDFAKKLKSLKGIEYRFNISSSDIDLQRLLISCDKNVPLHFDSQPKSYYCHVFGMENVSGRNCNLAVSIDGREFNDIGNLIIIEHFSKKIALESAFGIETIVTRINGLDSSILALPPCMDVEYPDSHMLLFIDALVSCIAILSMKIKPVATNRGRVLRRYLQGLSYLRIHTNTSLDEMENLAERFERKFFGSNYITHFILNYVQHYEQLRHEGINEAVINKILTKKTQIA